MSGDNSRVATEKRTREHDVPEASTSQSNSPSGTTPKHVDDTEDSSSKDDREDPEKTVTNDTDEPAPTGGLANTYAAPSQGDWQAIWAPAQNAYYFYNTRTNETTWTNPLQPSSDVASEPGASTSYTAESSSNSLHAAQAAAEAAGIDPSLAYLDPSLGLPSSTPAGTFTAKFNARTGAFARNDARDPSHLSESERAKRMSAVYFDVGAWEKEIEDRKEEEAAGSGKKRKRPTKKDLERFKEQKKQKKIAKTAWLRT